MQHEDKIKEIEKKKIKSIRREIVGDEFDGVSNANIEYAMEVYASYIREKTIEECKALYHFQENEDRNYLREEEAWHKGMQTGLKEGKKEDKGLENKDFRIEIGQNCYKDKQNDYAGKVGYVYFCNSCCKDWRIQFFSMGNNELLRNFDLKNCTIFFANKH